MNQKALKTLEFTKIIALLTERCLTPIGKKAAENLVPYETLREIEKAQKETEDALSRLYRFGAFSASGARDIRDSFARLRVQANLSISELMSISMLLATAYRCKQYGLKGDAETTQDSLTEYFELLEPLTTLQKEIDRCIISEEEIADDASANLSSIRRRMKTAESRVHTELQSLVMSHSNYLQTNVITMRNGRYCVPVKNEYRGQVPGMIHDESGSGSTVFIEPLSVVKLNNELRELDIEEKKEIEVILARLSAEADDHLIVLESDLKLLSHLDFVFAKASIAREMKATRPIFNEDHRINLKEARHPLLDKKTAVPISVWIGDTFDTLIVTGPNTGGKTVSLKTVGLLTLMGEAGLHIPAFEGSALGFFKEVYADIGDEQSIEQSLSTFSSHMKNLTGILRKADAESLVLMDELCAGTDPEEGAHLAIAILNALRQRGSTCMATTHYSELKLYALSTEGVENASCEFDVQTLSPTYHLLIGIPGKSNAFAISLRLGLDKSIVDEAKSGISQDTMAFEDVIKDLHDSKKKLERDKSMIGQLKAEAKNIKENLEKEEGRIEEKKEKILANARAEALKMLEDAKAQVDLLIRTMNKDGKDVRELEKVRTSTREMIDKAVGGQQETVSKSSNLKPEDLKIGDTVLVISMNTKGNIISLPDRNGKCDVRMGILTGKFPISGLAKVEEEDIRINGESIKTRKKPSGTFSKAATISSEINLIGMTVDEALAVLDKYLDDAYLSHLEKVRIVHGRGTGALRQAVQQQLRRLKIIDSFRLGEFGEGDTGVTIATFKR